VLLQLQPRLTKPLAKPTRFIALSGLHGVMNDHPRSFEEWYERKVEIEEEESAMKRRDPEAEREAREQQEEQSRSAF